MKKITVKLIQEDIDLSIKAQNIKAHMEGIKGSLWCESCPIAQALMRLFPDEKVNVGPTCCHVGSVTFVMPLKARNYIELIDSMTADGNYNIPLIEFDLIYPL